MEVEMNDQIAAEAACKLTGDTEGAAYRAAFQTIKSAIEKATAKLHADLADAEVLCAELQQQRDRAAHASERGILTHDGKRDAMSPLHEAEQASDFQPDPDSFVPIEDQRELAAHTNDVLDDHQKSMLAVGAAHASEPLRDSPEYRDQLRSNPRTCHLTHGKPSHASEPWTVTDHDNSNYVHLFITDELRPLFPANCKPQLLKIADAHNATLAQRPTPATDASEKFRSSCGCLVTDEKVELCDKHSGRAATDDTKEKE